MAATKRAGYWNNELWEAECTDCYKVFNYHMFRVDLKTTNANIKDFPKRRPVGSYCKDCMAVRNAKRWEVMSDYQLVYDRYKTIMRKEGNDVDMTYEEFMTYWPKNNKCPVRKDIVFQPYPKDDKILWTRGGRHWPLCPTVDHFYPDKPLNKNNFWIISWRANEMKSDMMIAEIESLYHATQQFKGKSYTGDTLLEIMDVEYKLDMIKEYVGKYTPERLESIKKHRKL
tara:strand:+ start:96 stop:779 length:684 start_codon:yes stop_codon:yes gene_type:complete